VVLMCPTCLGVLRPGRPRMKSASLLRAQSISIFLECAGMATLSLSLRRLQPALWTLRGTLADQKCSFNANWISLCGSTVEVITPVAPGPSVI